MMGNKRHIDEMAFVRDVQILHCQVNPAYWKAVTSCLEP
jgi:hypothetical protein